MSRRDPGPVGEPTTPDRGGAVDAVFQRLGRKAYPLLYLLLASFSLGWLWWVGAIESVTLTSAWPFLAVTVAPGYPVFLVSVAIGGVVFGGAALLGFVLVGPLLYAVLG